MSSVVASAAELAQNRNKNSIELHIILFYYFNYVECRIALRGGCGVGLSPTMSVGRNNKNSGDTPSVSL